MKEMAQVLHHLNESLAEDHKSLKYLQNIETGVGTEITASRDMDIFKGRIEALEFAIKQIEEAMEQYQKAEAVNQMTNYLLTGDRGEHGTKESN